MDSCDSLPTKVRLESTTACQLRCPLCPTASGKIGQSLGVKSLKFEKFKKFINENPKIQEVELSNWGELFLNPDIVEIMKFAFEKKVSLTAGNGSNLNTVSDEALEAIVKYQFKSINCSIDGVSQEVYEKYRVRGKIDNVLKNIKKINEYKIKYKSKFPKLNWQYVAFGHNEHEILQAKELAAELGMTFRLKLSWDESFSPIKNVDLIRNESGTGAANRTELQKKTGEVYASNSICHQLWVSPQINPDGRMLGCCVNHWADFGNVFETSFEEVINGPKMQYARKMIMGQVPSKEDIPCAKCHYFRGMQKLNSWIKPPKEK